MAELPADVQAALLRAVGVYLRTADQNELPPHLKRLRGFRPNALAKHKTELLGALDLGPTRALILQWLDEAKPPISKADGAVLRAAAGAGDGWRESFAVPPPPGPAGGHPDRTAEHLQEQLEREKARAVKARAAERAAKDALAQATRGASVKESAQSREIARLEQELVTLQEELGQHRSATSKVRDERARERRRTERDMEKERQAKQDAERALKDVRRDLRDREAELSELMRRLGKIELRDGGGPGEVQAQDTTSGQSQRIRLKAPQGLLDEDPKSLRAWLQTDRVHLLIDGYNVSKSGTGFANLSLEDQRMRVVQVVNRLARKNDLTPIVVFDGAEMAPGTRRRARGSAIVEYSTGEIADDHLIARLEGLPSDPVVFITDDKELQRRAAALGATIATSGQLLALAR